MTGLAGGLLLAALLAAEAAALVGAARSALATPGKAGSPAWTVLAKLRRSPLVLLLAFAFFSDVAIVAGRALLLADAPRPFVGLARAWYSVEIALVVGGPCAVWLASWRLLAGEHDPWRERAACFAWGAWIGVSVGLASAYPFPRGTMADAGLVVELAAVAASWAAVARGWRSRLAGRLRWTLPEVALLVLVGVETAVATIGPWVRNPFADWHLARASYLLGFSTIAALHVQAVRARTGL